MTKQASQRDRILELLKAAGDGGVSNLVLNEICFRYGARIWELRQKDGWDIETICEGESIFRFVLRGKKQAEQLRLIA